MTIEWRPIPLAISPDQEVSSDGRVRRTSDGRERTLSVDKRGYRRLTLYRSDTHRPFNTGAHRLVLLAFIGPPETGRDVVRHLDGDPTNNYVGNLAWGTQSENLLDTVRHGRDWHLNRTHCPHGHLYSEENTYRTPKTGARNCRTCVQERNRSNRVRREAAYAERAAKDPQSLAHGTYSTYSNYRCRCDPCSAAARNYNARRRSV